MTGVNMNVEGKQVRRSSALQWVSPGVSGAL